MTAKIKRLLIFIVHIVIVITGSVELPPCPVNVPYFPQKLPMHCRYPNNTYPQIIGIPQVQIGTSNYYGTTPGSLKPVPFPAPYSGSLPASMSAGMSAGMQPGMHPSIQGDMQLGMQPNMQSMMQPGQKLPVVVMPVYSQNTSYKKYKRQQSKRKHSDSAEVDTSYEGSDSSSPETTEGEDHWSGKRERPRGSKRGRRLKSRKHVTGRLRRYKKKRNVIIPILQYVTKDGYVVYEKRIGRPEAKEWLNMNNNQDKRHNIRNDYSGQIYRKRIEKGGISYETDNDGSLYNENEFDTFKKRMGNKLSKKS